MNIVLVMVSSINGKTTHDMDPDVTHWTSTEDQKLFGELKKKYKLIVMGSHTYENNIHRIQLSNQTLRIVLTKQPRSFKHEVVTGQLEFSDESPHHLIRRLESLGYKTMLLVGGSEVNSSFFKEHLIDTLILTIEPKLFGTGKNLLADIPAEIELQLVEVKKMNARGTLHLVYRVIKNNKTTS